MISPGERVIVGVSGGADSVCLLFVLLKCMEKIPFSLHTVHVNHGIRKEAGQDAAYVKSICDRFQLPFTLVEENVRERAMQEKRSEEEMGRLVRYNAFEKVLRETGAQKIAVAHNSNDRAETMLFHLFRGSGLSGLCGIRPVRDHIIRPVLCLERKEIEGYLAERGIDYCRDATNDEDDYTRNRIRHHILSYAENEVVQGCTAHMSQTAAMLLETEEMLERLTGKAREQAVQMQTVQERVAQEYVIDCGEYACLEPVIGKRLIYQLLMELSPGGRDIANVHVEDVEELLRREGNRHICLPYGIIAERQYGKVRLKREADSTAVKIQGEAVITPQDLAQGIVEIPAAGDTIFNFQVISCKKYEDIPKNRYTKWFDYDKIKKSLTVRTRNTGDFLSIRGANDTQIHKSVKDYMVTEKIPRQERHRIPVIAEEDHVLWLVGYRISEYYKISENTKRILQVQLKRDCECSEMEENNGRTC